MTIPGSARKGRKRLTPAARWRRRFGARGVTASLLSLNLPDHAAATVGQQAAWVARRMRRTDFATIAECNPFLAAAINRRKGLSCRLATQNFGGNGNAIVVNERRVQDVKFSDYPVQFVANSGARFTLHMARARATKRRVRFVVDGIHAPSRGRYKTSASDDQRQYVFEQVARNKPRDFDVWLMGGDTNWLSSSVVRALTGVDRSWRHLGGRGVEQVYGIGATRLGQRTLRYGRASDHQVTARVTIGHNRKA